MKIRKLHFFLVFLLLILTIALFKTETTRINQENNDISENINLNSSALNCVPKGLIVLWNDLNIPNTWVKCNGSNGTPELNNTFVYGVLNNGEQPGIKGGSETHTHEYSELPEHTHTITDPGHSHEFGAWNLDKASDEADDDGWGTGLTIAKEGTQNKDCDDQNSYTDITIEEEGLDNCQTDETSNIPPYYRLSFIMNNQTSSSLPIGSIVMWSDKIDEIPEGWELCDGSNGTPLLLDRFIYGVKEGQVPGEIGGNTLHEHSYGDIPKHSHPIVDPGHKHAIQTWGGTKITDRDAGNDQAKRKNTWSSVTSETAYTGITVNDEGVENCETDKAENILPPYYKIAFIMKKSDVPGISPIPKGIITIWANTIDSIPDDWIFCNGANSLTPNLSGKFLRSVSGGEDPGQFGGTLTHYHTYTDLPKHNHDVNDPGHEHNCDVITGTTVSIDIPSWGDYPHGCGTGTSDQDTEDSLTGISIIEEGQVNCQTEDASHLPPYYKVAFILSDYTYIPPVQSPDNGGDDDTDNSNDDDKESNLISIPGLFILAGVGGTTSLIVGVAIKKRKSSKKQDKLIDKLLE
ncbi:MAG: hypothetical protein GF353_17435 [Candidatus Lokiarchaeota archaeon]|nr:hypothetical protein [Candidatus Lokiarchaeota archaeon]